MIDEHTESRIKFSIPIRKPKGRERKPNLQVQRAPALVEEGSLSAPEQLPTQDGLNDWWFEDTFDADPSVKNFINLFATEVMLQF